MRRRRIDIVESDVRDAIKSQAKGIFAVLVRILINKLVAAVVAMLVNKGWIDDPDGFDEPPLGI